MADGKAVIFPPRPPPHSAQRGIAVLSLFKKNFCV